MVKSLTVWKNMVMTIAEERSVLSLKQLMLHYIK